MTPRLLLALPVEPEPIRTSGRLARILVIPHHAEAVLPLATERGVSPFVFPELCSPGRGPVQHR